MNEIADRHLWSFPRVMGIVNINDDSFSGDGTLDPTVALRRAGEMIGQGADIIDIGAESARTNRAAISEAEEIARLLPFIEGWRRLRDAVSPRDALQWPRALLSVNTWRPEVVAAVLETGQADIINDIGGLTDAANASLCARHGAFLLIMHTVGLPKVPHFSQRYADVWEALESFFESRIALAQASGVAREKIILDPGIDFAKQRDDNLAIYREIERLRRFGCPVLLPVSRKTVIGEVLGIPDPAMRDAGTVACIARGLRGGAHIFRVHNVKAAAEAIRVLKGVAGA